MPDNGNLNIKITTDVSGVVAGTKEAAEAFDVTTLSAKECQTQIASLEAVMSTPAGKLNPQIAQSVAELKAQVTALSTAETASVAPAVAAAEAQAELAASAETTGLSLSKQKVIFTDLARGVTGAGFGIRNFTSNFALLGPEVAIAAFAIYEIVKAFTAQSDAQKRASDEAKKLTTELRNLEEAASNIKSNSGVIGEATGGATGDLERVRELASAIQDTTKSYSERKNALELLRETNKAYFGDLTLEASSLAGLTVKVQEYSKALVAEAITKSFVQEIAELSKKSADAGEAVETLREKLGKLKGQQDDLNSKPVGPVFTVGGGQSSVSQEDFLAIKVKKDIEDTTTSLGEAKDAFFAFQDAVVAKNKALDQAIQNQIQFKPLVVDPKSKDELKSLLDVLEKIKKAQDELAKPDERSIHQRQSDSTNPVDIKVFQTKISEALQNAAKDPKTKEAYLQLATVLGQQLNKLQNPNLSSHVQGIVDVKPDDVSEIESKIEKQFGNKGLKVSIPLDVELRIDQQYSKEQAALLKKSLEEQVKNGLPIIRFTPKIQAIIDKKAISDALSVELAAAVTSAIKNTVESGLKTFGETLGESFSSGNPLEKVLQSIGNTLGEGLKAIGQALIKVGVEKLAIDKAIKALNISPGLAIIAGVAAIALGTALESSLNKTSQKAFATGGIVTGPTNALIGEAGPEVVFPLDRLNSFVKNITSPSNAPQTIKVTGQISGNNLNIVSARQTKFNNQVS